LGTYDLLDLYLFPDGGWVRNLSYTIIGLFIMFLTSNIKSEGSVILDTVEGAQLLTSASAANVGLVKSPSLLVTSVSSCVLYHIKALIALYGDVLYWVGAYSLVDVDMVEYSDTRDALYIVGGFLVFLILSIVTYNQRKLQYEALKKKKQQLRESLSRSSSSIVSSSSSSHPPHHQYQQLPKSSSVPPHNPHHLHHEVTLVHPSGLAPSPPITFSARFQSYCRHVLAMIAGLFYWVGWWNILSYSVVNPYDEAEEEYEGEDKATNLINTVLIAVTDLSNSTETSLDPSDRFSPSSTSFPMYVLYLIWFFTGLFLLGITNTFTSNSGVVQPINLINAQADLPNETTSNEATAATTAVTSEHYISGDHQFTYAPISTQPADT